MDHAVLVEKHLTCIESYLKELDLLNSMQFKDYGKNIIAQRFAERTLHLMLEEMLNTVETIIKYKQFRQPNSHDDAFTVLYEHNIIPENFHQTAKDIADFGKRLIYDYKTLKPDITFAVVQNGPKDIRLFVKLIRHWLNADNILEQIS